jgi:subtilisin family serine protease
MHYRAPRIASVIRFSLLVLHFLILAGLGGVFFAGNASQANAPRLPYAPDAVLVAFRDDVPQAARLNLAQSLGATPDTRVKSRYFARLRLTPQARAAGVTVASAVARLRANPAVRIAEPDYRMNYTAAPNDPRFGELWGLHNTGQTGGRANAHISAVEAWGSTVGSDEVIVAVLDSGVDYNHEDLTDNILRDAQGRVVGRDFFNDTDDPMDAAEHGTHVAGTIGARGNNGIGISGVNQRVKIMPCKIGDAQGASVGAAIQALDFATERGARVSCNSWGSTNRSDLLLEAIVRARAQGHLFVAAAGNGDDQGNGIDNDITPHYPSGFSVETDNVISVAASDHNDQFGTFSNFGLTSVNLAAPGVSILSTIPNNGYASWDGTSMAAPHVAGALGLILSQDVNMPAAELRARLYDAVENLPNMEGRLSTGGRLSLPRALRNLRVLAPNGGEVFSNGDSTLVRWRSNGFAAGHLVRIELSRDGGVSYRILADNVPDTGEWEWTISETPSSQCRIRITSRTHTTLSDASDRNFRIVDGSLTLETPRGGERAFIGTRLLIEWHAEGFAAEAARVRIELSRDGGDTWEILFRSVENTGRREWMVQGPETEEARVRVTSLSRPEYTDESEDDFIISVTPRIKVTGPAGGERLRVGEFVDIEWESAGFDGNVRIDLARNGGATEADWVTLFPNVENDGFVEWRVSGPATTSARIRVVSLRHPEVRALSNGLFRIIAPTLRVTRPAVNQRTVVGGTETVTWTSSGLEEDDELRIEVSRDGGASWRTVQNRVPNTGSASWRVTQEPTEAALVRITSLDDSNVTAVSERFSIRRPEIFLVNPEGQTRWRIGKLHTITWSGTVVGHGTVNVELSRDGGRTWRTILQNVENTGGARWGVRGKATNRALVRVTWSQDRGVSSRSRRAFKIQRAPGRRR